MRRPLRRLGDTREVRDLLQRAIEGLEALEGRLTTATRRPRAPEKIFPDVRRAVSDKFFMVT